MTRKQTKQTDRARLVLVKERIRDLTQKQLATVGGGTGPGTRSTDPICNSVDP